MRFFVVAHIHIVLGGGERKTMVHGALGLKTYCLLYKPLWTIYPLIFVTKGL